MSVNNENWSRERRHDRIVHIHSGIVYVIVGFTFLHWDCFGIYLVRGSEEYQYDLVIQGTKEIRKGIKLYSLFVTD